MRKQVRQYFFGKTKILPAILIVLGIIFMVVPPLGICLLLVGIVMLIISLVGGSYEGQGEVDSAVAQETARLSKRGMDKLGLVAEDTSLITPICLTGFGVTPDANLGTTEKEFMKTKGIIGFFSKAGKSKTDDPVELYKIGSDDVLRSMLISVTVFAFTEEQMLVYSGNVDISTSTIYDEFTSEIFYTDIASIDTFETLSKQWNPKKKKFTYFTKESIAVIGNGISDKYSFRVLNGETYVNQQFMAMKNLIREKKKA